MGKPYVRHQAKHEVAEYFTCTKCEKNFDTKVEFKKHWQESEDHNQKKLK